LKEAAWAPEPVWKFWRTQNICPLLGFERQMSGPHPNHVEKICHVISFLHILDVFPILPSTYGIDMLDSTNKIMENAVLHTE